MGATTARLSSEYRMLKGWMEGLLNVPLSVGTANNQGEEARGAVAEPMAEAPQYVPQPPVVPVDETGFRQGGADGGNPEGRNARKKFRRRDTWRAR